MPVTKDGVRVSDEAWPPSYVRVIGIPTWVTIAWAIATVAVLGLLIWIAVEIHQLGEAVAR